MSNSFSDQTVDFATLVELLRWRALRQPDRRAYTFLLDGETTEAHLTYADLDRQARAIGVQLQRRGAAGERALLLYPPGLDYIAAFFGCLYAGAVAVPAYPPNPARLERTLPRLRAIMADARPSIALTTAALLPIAEALSVQDPVFQATSWLASDTLADQAADDWRDPTAQRATLAFLQYTSGSTAAPRGVMLTQGNLLHNSALIHRAFAHTPQSQGVIWLPPYHDMGLIGGILQPLYGGFGVVLLSPVDFLQRPLRWLQAVSRYRATTSGGPNFAYDLCVRKTTPEQRAALDLSSWTVAFNGAEPVRPATLDRFAEAFAPCGFRREAFYPCYGLAEATLIVTGGQALTAPLVRAFDRPALEQHRVVAADASAADAQLLVGCGASAPDQQLVIAGSAAARSPDGQVGEIWVCGPSVAQGYWERPQETEQTFCARLADGDSGPWLRTGDLGFVQDGELFVTGRIKDLIIIRGRNHYPQDIELTAERSHMALRPGCGAAFAVEVAGEERLVVVQEVERQQRQLDTAEVAGAIRQAVAEQHEAQVYAVALLKAGSIPKTSSGKIQRHACRADFLADRLELVGSSVLDDAPAADGGDADLATEAVLRRDDLLAYAPEARGPLLETYLRAQVAHALRVAPAQIDPHQPAGALGLDSLMAVELQHMIEAQLGVVLPMVSFLEDRSITRLAADILAELNAPAPPETWRAPIQDGVAHPLTAGQRALWFLHQLAPSSAAYNIASAVRIQGDLDGAALRRAFQALVDRHPALRTTFSDEQGDPAQQVHARGEIAFQTQDATAWSVAALDELLAAESQRPFDLERGPLLRVHLLRRAAHEHLLLLVVHHIAADLWSLAVLTEELGPLYAAEQAGQAAALAPIAVRYTDYVYWQNSMLAGVAGERLWSYWQQQLAAAPPALELPSDRPRPPVQTYRGAAHAFALAPDLTGRLKARARAAETTLYTALLAAFQALLHRYTGQEDILVGSPTIGRSRDEWARVVGYFVNPVVLRVDLSSAPTFTALLAQARQAVLAALAHQDYPFALLVERLQPERDPSRSPLFQVMFVLQKAHLLDDAGLTAFALGEGGARIELGGLRVESVALEQRVAQFDLTLVLAEADGGLAGSLQYNADLFDGTTIGRLAEHFRTLLEGVSAGPQLRIANLPLLTAAEREQLLIEWNATAAEYPREHCIHDLFVAQAARTPDRVALVFGGRGSGVRGLGDPLRGRGKETRPAPSGNEGRQGDKACPEWERGETRSQESGVRSQESGFLTPTPYSPLPNRQFAALSPQSSVLSPQTLTYRELNERANRLAHHLQTLGVGPEVRVGICVERTPEVVVALLGVLKAGGAYVPLDPAYPDERLAFMLEDSQAAVLITTNPETRRQGDPLRGRGKETRPAPSGNEGRQGDKETEAAQAVTPSPLHPFTPSPLHPFTLSDSWPAIALYAPDAPSGALDPTNLAYIIYTSGSTGIPKGVAITHCSAVALLHWARSAFTPDQVRGVLASTSICFDLSVFELFVPLSCGGTVILAENALQLPQLPDATCVTLINTVPSAMTELLREGDLPTSVQVVNLAGEPLPLRLVQQLYEQPALAQVVNLYGPSEDTTYSTCAMIERASVLPPAIGRPIANTRAYVLDRHMQPLPLGVAGELYLGGAGLARGYLARPALTAERFIPNPFQGMGDGGWGMGNESSIPHPPSPIPRLYKTGDLVRYRADGNLEFLGRLDAQVKLRGYRIELGEVEAALERHPGVRESVVVVREDAPGDARLVAYVVLGSGVRGQGSGRPPTGAWQGDQACPEWERGETTRPGDKEIEGPTQSSVLSPQSSVLSELRGFLKATLPDYMVPSAFVQLEALPLTPNGKLDRRALPAPDGSRPELRDAFVAPRTPLEERLAAIWAEVLGLQRVGVHDNFFALGGHSLKATQVMSRVRHEFQVELPLHRLFEEPTVTGLAGLIAQGQGSLPAAELGEIVAIPRGDRSIDELLAELEGLSDDEVLALLGSTGSSADDLGAHLDDT